MRTEILCLIWATVTNIWYTKDDLIERAEPDETVSRNVTLRLHRKDDTNRIQDWVLFLFVKDPHLCLQDTTWDWVTRFYGLTETLLTVDPFSWWDTWQKIPRLFIFHFLFLSFPLVFFHFFMVKESIFRLVFSESVFPIRSHRKCTPQSPSAEDMTADLDQSSKDVKVDVRYEVYLELPRCLCLFHVRSAHGEFLSLSSFRLSLPPFKILQSIQDHQTPDSKDLPCWSHWDFIQHCQSVVKSPPDNSQFRELMGTQVCRHRQISGG